MSDPSTPWADRPPAWLRSVPKAELHVHLEGSVTAELARRLASRNGVAVPPAPPAEGFADFGAFIRGYLAISRCFVHAVDFAEAIVDLARRHAAQGVVWSETTFTPLTHVARGVAPEVIAEGLVVGRRRAREEHGVHVRWVFDVVRGFDDQAMPTLEFMRRVERLDPGAVAAIGLGGPEAMAPGVQGVRAAFDAARAEGFASVPHAGELVGPSSIWDAVRWLGAQRLGHGVRCLEDEALVRHLVEHAIVLEVCPTSNVRLGVAGSWAEHPLPRLLEAGLAVTLGSDDPTLFGSDLVGEYVAAHDTFGWDDATVLDLAAASLRHAWMPAALRDGWLAEVDAVRATIAAAP